MMVDRLNSTPLVLQLPIGAESDFLGVVDLVGMRALTWRGETKMGEDYDRRGDPGRLAEQAAEYREKFLETLAEADDAIMEKYLEGEFTVEELEAAIRRATLADKLNPVLCGTAFKNKGVQPLLDAVVKYLPRPSTSRASRPLGQGRERGDHPQALRRRAVLRAGLQDRLRPAPRQADLRPRLLGQARGGLDRGQLGQRPQGADRQGLPDARNKREEIASVGAGQIVAVMGLKDTKTGHTLSDPQHQVILESMTFPAR